MFIFFGVLISLVGFLWLLGVLGLLPDNYLQLLFPFLLIFIGIYIVFLHFKVRLFWKSFWVKKIFAIFDIYKKNREKK